MASGAWLPMQRSRTTQRSEKLGHAPGIEERPRDWSDEENEGGGWRCGWMDLIGGGDRFEEGGGYRWRRLGGTNVLGFRVRQII